VSRTFVSERAPDQPSSALSYQTAGDGWVCADDVAQRRDPGDPDAHVVAGSCRLNSLNGTVKGLNGLICTSHIHFHHSRCPGLGYTLLTRRGWSRTGEKLESLLIRGKELRRNGQDASAVGEHFLGSAPGSRQERCDDEGNDGCG
jgi:hypothetical protein